MASIWSRREREERRIRILFSRQFHWGLAPSFPRGGRSHACIAARSPPASPTFVRPQARRVIHPRVEAVGPRHFGIVALDCAKARSRWMITDFFGKILVGPATVEHRADALRAAVE